jgi:hypothetical protein
MLMVQEEFESKAHFRSKVQKQNLCGCPEKKRNVQLVEVGP